MKTLKFAAFLLATSSAVFFTSCDNDDDDTPAAQTKTELLTKSEWKDVDLLFGGQSLIGDTSANYTPGQVKLRFQNSGSYTLTDASDSSSANGTWKFIENDSKMVLSDQSSSDTVAVSVLTNTNLNLLWYGGLIEQRFAH